MTKEALFTALKKALLEALRWFVLAIIPVLIVYFGALPYEWAAWLTIALRFADKIIHELGKELKEDGLIKGLTRF